MLNTKCSNTQEVVVGMVPGDTEQNPVRLEPNAVKVTVVRGDGKVGPITQLEDGSWDIVLISQDAPGTGQTEYLLEPDVDPGEGVEILSETIILDVISQKAVSLGLGIKAVRAKTPPAPAQ